MASGDIYEVTDVQVQNDQQVLNVYFYEQRAAFVPTSGTTAQALADEWSDIFIPLIEELQTDDLIHVETRVRNLFDDTDQGLTVTGIPGSWSPSADSMPTFNAIGFKLSTDNASVRPGAKRYGATPEAAATDGVLIADAITAGNLLGDALAAPITGGLIITDDIMFPVVVQRVREGVEGAYTYRLPETSGEAVVGTIIEALLKVIVTSQLSRKIGVGL